MSEKSSHDTPQTEPQAHADKAQTPPPAQGSRRPRRARPRPLRGLGKGWNSPSIS